MFPFFPQGLRFLCRIENYFICGDSRSPQLRVPEATLYISCHLFCRRYNTIRQVHRWNLKRTPSWFLRIFHLSNCRKGPSSCPHSSKFRILSEGTSKLNYRAPSLSLWQAGHLPLSHLLWIFDELYLMLDKTMHIKKIVFIQKLHLFPSFSWTLVSSLLREIRHPLCIWRFFQVHPWLTFCQRK